MEHENHWKSLNERELNMTSNTGLQYGVHALEKGGKALSRTAKISHTGN